MTSEKDVRPITYMKTNSAELLREVQDHRRPVYITQNGEARAVLQDLREFQKQRKLLMLLRVVALGEQDIKQKNIYSQKEVFTSLDEKLAQEAGHFLS